MMYRVFSRSARSFETFSRARKTTIRYVNTEQEAQELCASYNDNRNAQQIRRGTKWEYEKE